MKIVTIVGARPQFIKAAALSREISQHNDIKEILVHTGQHFDANMSDVFFNEMDIPLPNYNLNINNLRHGAMTGQMLEKIEQVLLKELPDYVIVYGDTNSTIAGALAAKKLHIKVAHVEAGLRSFNMNMPEEINRILTDRISDVLFCPTDTAIENLKNEGFVNFNVSIVKSGDVMQDAAIYYTKKEQKPEFNLPDRFILATIHRAENTDNSDRLKNIFEAFIEINKNLPIVLPLHPRTKKIIEQQKINTADIQIVNPAGYLQMIYMLNRCQLVMTDSGGLQKEAFFFGKLCITLREETEWVELLENKCNFLADANKSKIIRVFENLPLETDFNKNLYGNGLASKNIVDYLLKKHL